MQNKKITIVFLIDFLATREGVTGGTERQLIETINRLDKRKFRPLLFCLQDLFPTKLWEETHCEKSFLHVYSLKKIQTVLKLIRFSYYLKRNNVDIVQTFFFDSTIFGVIAAKLAGVNTIISCRRDLGFWYEKKLISKLKFVNYFTDYFIVNCRAIKNILSVIENVDVKKIKILPNGIDLLNKFPLSSQKKRDCLEKVPPDRFEVCLVANFNRKVKRVDLFIRAAAEVYKYYPQIKFIIIGGGNLENELRSLAQKLKVEDSVVFMGRVDNKNLNFYLNQCSVGVNCSDSEGLSNVILEYYANKMPVVATNVGGNSDLVIDSFNGFLKDKGDYKGIANSIVYLFENQDVAVEMGQRGFMMVKEKYSWENSIRLLENFYEQVSRKNG